MCLPPPETFETKEGTVLLVDDQPEQIDIIRSALERYFVIKVATRGTLAINIARTSKIDLILLDILMPDMDGHEVCRQIKNDPAISKIPIIFLTSKDGQHDEAVCLELGAVDFIRKPSSPLVLLTRCRNTIAYHHAKEKLHQKNKELAEKNQQLQELNNVLKNLATIDGLTGIPNRRKYDEYLVQAWNRALRDQSPISLIVIDIDFFKQFNDNYGHAAGDECLKNVAQTLASTMVRAIDLMARYGGEEFVCILPNTDAAGLIRVGNQLIENINRLYIPHRFSSVAKHVTISLGVGCPKTPFYVDRFLDQRLQEA
ncbi:MAG: diguanylate cyclase response regulator [Magnetococcales bacterium]|nr:diguanylate cyclase response regulator [Magnetococcales bacterium]HIJ82798.1 diguanylate cyclase [Magnetococcales bacterium]